MDYRLDENLNPERCQTIQEYLEWHGTMPAASDWYERKTKYGFVLKREPVGDREVSTVYLGIDCRIYDDKPILWETMVFPDAKIAGRYATHASAMAGHKKAVQAIENGEWESGEE